METTTMENRMEKKMENEMETRSHSLIGLDFRKENHSPQLP